MVHHRRHLIGAIAFTAVIAILIGLAVSDRSGYLPIVQVATIVAAAAVINGLFRRSVFFTISLANFIAIYTCIFYFFVETNFATISTWVLFPGYILPVAAFLIGVWRRREAIEAIVGGEKMTYERTFASIFGWLVPVFGIGALTFVLPDLNLSTFWLNTALILAMAAIALIVLVVSRQVAMFLVDTGLLFEEFFERIAGLLIPAFAFFTFYSLVVIVFACVYRILDRFTDAPLFLINEQAQELSFSQALYFSIITLSTVGYGDIVPRVELVEILVAVQIVCGVMLLLFGFNEILRYSREHEQHKSKRDKQ